MYLLKEFGTLKLITSVSQLTDNIRNYNEHLDKLAHLMPYNRSWYALREEDDWLLGPSKYVGYDGVTWQKFLGSNYDTKKHGRIQRENPEIVLDGRITESVLSSWSDLVENGHPAYAELHSALSQLCARFGKKPNSLARISIVRLENGPAAKGFTDDLVTLLATVFRALTPAQKSAFRRQIA
jgi:hypothetical protein